MSVAHKIDNTAAAEQLLKKAHVRLLRHRKTYLYSGVLLLGNSAVDNSKARTACTNGLDKFYNADFITSLKSIAEVAGIVLHEALHVFLKQIPRHKDLWDADPQVCNAAADYVVNAIIKDIEAEDRAALAANNVKDHPVVVLPESGLYDAKFINWSMRQVYNYLKKEDEQEQDQPKPEQGNEQGQPEQGGGGKPEQEGRPSVTVDGKEYSLETHDEHDTSGVDDMTDDEIKDMIEKIDQGIQEAGLLAGLSGVKLPRAVQELLEPEVKWEDVVQDFFLSHSRGSTDYTFSKFNRRRIIDELYRPSTYKERLGRVVLAIDTSGSISQHEINRVTSLIVMLCEQCPPEELSVLWWDTQVHGRQDFTEDAFANLRSALKPMGFGGTRVSCVSEYMTANNMDADCLIVFTDGYVESNITWSVHVPTLWVVKGNEQFVPPMGGKLVKFK